MKVNRELSVDIETAVKCCGEGATHSWTVTFSLSPTVGLYLPSTVERKMKHARKNEVK